MKRSFAHAALPALAAACGLLLVACSTPVQTPDPQVHAGNTVSIDHPMGPTEVPIKPEIVVAFSSDWSDAFAALGAPVELSFRSEEPLGPFPWENPASENLSWVPPGESNQAAHVLERIRDADPDLILAGWVAATDLYEELSEIAPTVVNVPQAESAGDSWVTVTRQAGEILSLQDAADALIAKVTERIRALPAQHPGLDGATVAIVPRPEFDAEGPTVAKTLESLGLTLVTDAADADLIVDLSNTAGDHSGVVFAPGDDLNGVIAALYNPSVQSLPWLLDVLEPSFTALDERHA